MENEDENAAEIQLLPYDIIITALEYTSTIDIINFGATCKKFNELVKSSHSLWKQKLRNSVNEQVLILIEKKTNGNWLEEIKRFTSLQSELHARLIDMAAYFYSNNRDILLYEVRQFFNNTYSDGLLYYCTIEILQGFLRKARKNTYMQFGNKPFTLTEKHYAKSALQHLLHPYLAIKWMQGRMANKLSPEFVLNFFIQWVDPCTMHTDEEVDNLLNSLGSMVEKELKKNRPRILESVVEQCAKGNITEDEILAAISHVMYKQKRMTVVSVANLETLDIVKVFEMGCGQNVVIGAIFAALAKKFGVWCELISFSNHLFLELRGSQNRVNEQVYRINLHTGKLEPRRSCPFSATPNQRRDYRYCPNSLLQYVISAYLQPMGSYQTWNMQNAIYLLDFLNSDINCDNKYKTYLPYLTENSHLPVLSTPIELTNLTEEQLKIITLLSYQTKPSSAPRNKPPVRRRCSKVRFAVGMVVQHTVYNYLCVVRGWEPSGPPRAYACPAPAPLQDGHSQLFYNVVAIDQSHRFVPQELLEVVGQPSRLYHLEDILAREFTHFNGFAYEPNMQKRAEYPGDLAVSNYYRSRAETTGGKNLQE